MILKQLHKQHFKQQWEVKYEAIKINIINNKRNDIKFSYDDMVFNFK